MGVPWSRWRTSPADPWTWMQPGESIALPPPQAKVSLDYNDPESCVIQIEKKNRRYRSFAVKKSDLPAGWITGVDQASGQTYYTNEMTGQSQLEAPQ